MCGIAGFESSAGDPRAANVLAECLANRGPDGEWILRRDAFTLVQTRLSVIDLSDRVRYPMPNESGDVWLLFNGEIYGHGRLRRELERRGHSFATDCDAEVVVHAYEEWDIDGFRRLNGMFAVALLDERGGRLVLGSGPLRDQAAGQAASGPVRVLLGCPQSRAGGALGGTNRPRGDGGVRGLPLRTAPAGPGSRTSARSIPGPRSSGASMARSGRFAGPAPPCTTTPRKAPRRASRSSTPPCRLLWGDSSWRTWGWASFSPGEWTPPCCFRTPPSREPAGEPSRSPSRATATTTSRPTPRGLPAPSAFHMWSPPSMSASTTPSLGRPTPSTAPSATRLLSRPSSLRPSPVPTSRWP